MRSIVIALLATIQLVTFAANYQLPLSHYLWYCDFAPALLAIFFWLNKTQAIKGFLNIILFGQFGYIAIYLAKILFDVTLMEFVFEYELQTLPLTATIIIHLSALVAFVATYKEPTQHYALYYSVAILILTYAIIRNFAPPTGDDLTNYNLIYHSHLLASFPYYSQLWIVLAFTFVALPTHFFQYTVSWLAKRYL